MKALKIFGAALLLLLVVLGTVVATAWAPDRPVASLKARWATAPSQFIRIDGMDVHIRDERPRDDP